MHYQNLEKSYQGVQVLIPQSNEEISAEDLQAECAADTIAAMIENHFPVMNADGTVRPCEYKDFCLLFRTLKSAKPIGEVFRKRGIPFSCEEENGFLELPMAGVLLSPIYGFMPEDLAMLKVSGEKHQQKRIYLQMQNLTEQENFNLAQKCNIFLTQMQQMRSLADTMPMEQFIYEIYEMTAFHTVCTILSGSSGCCCTKQSERMAALSGLYEGKRRENFCKSDEPESRLCFC